MSGAIQGRILVVDDERSMREFLEIALQRAGHEVVTSHSVEDAISHLDQARFDLVITDLRMQGASGLDLLHYVKQNAPQTEVIVVTAFASYDSALDAMKAGAYDYLKKPFKIDEILLVSNRALERHRLALENEELKRRLSATVRFGQIVGRSQSMRRVFDLIEKVAASRSNILVTGESGTGKELVARAIHDRSPRSDAPFLAVNCGAIPSNLLESELFGHVRGAFTGAERDRHGLFRQAEGGTLLLDEVGELEQTLQVKLLRVLQERRVRPVGSDRDFAVDVRVIAATNRDLLDWVREGRFREDLYYRLNVIEIHVPPLRDRRDDIPLLVDHFRRKYAQESGKAIRGVTPAAMKKFVEHSYPGNVRELENLVERAVTLASGDWILPEDVVGVVRSSDQGALSLEEMRERGQTLDDALGEMESRLIRQALEATQGNRTEAAKLLGISFRSMRYRLDKLGIE